MSRSYCFLISKRFVGIAILLYESSDILQYTTLKRGCRAVHAVLSAEL